LFARREWAFLTIQMQKSYATNVSEKCLLVTCKVLAQFLGDLFEVGFRRQPETRNEDARQKWKQVADTWNIVRPLLVGKPAKHKCP